MTQLYQQIQMNQNFTGVIVGVTTFFARVSFPFLSFPFLSFVPLYLLYFSTKPTNKRTNK